MARMNPRPVCAEPCPEAAQVTCRLEPGNHLEHFGGYDDDVRSWANAAYVEPPIEDNFTDAAKAKAHLTAMARRLRQAQ